MGNNNFLNSTLLILILLTFNVNCQKPSQNNKAKNYGVKGIVTFQGKPVDWAFVYVYNDEDISYKKEYAAISKATKRDGNYQISPKPGKYFVVARKRWNYASTGPLRIGDYQIDYKENPITIEENKWVEINLELAEIKSELSISPQKNTGIKGRIISKNSGKKGVSFMFI
ncbi:MAG: hypothetical protein ABII25_04260 [bacterium]